MHKNKEQNTVTTYSLTLKANYILTIF